MKMKKKTKELNAIFNEINTKIKKHEQFIKSGLISPFFDKTLAELYMARDFINKFLKT
jgi:hypothetical protein